ncbi:Eukaryotic aspartyl protease-like protein 1 [Elsinoe fawcettii]|nr:Eukaryotic aspartyl protease-like protein 1 [Elsinoe fawcettii]
MRSHSAQGVLATLFLLILTHISAASAGSILTAERLSTAWPTLLRRATNTTNVAEPISFAPSQYWEGNDGLWSTFPLQVGTPPQVVRVIPSTAGYNNWVIAPRGCPASYPDTCPDERGALYNFNDSSTWRSRSIFQLGLNQNLGYDATGAFGFDKVTLAWQGSGGPTDDNAIVASYQGSQYWLGIFGLKPQATNFTTLNEPQTSFMNRLRDRNLIPSLSYGYTAGNRYRMNGVYGSLTLGGYDASRFNSTNVTFPFYQDVSRDLLVNVQSIGLQSEGADLATFGTSFPAFVDSTVPHLYLPLAACEVFERAFSLTWNATLNRYPVSGTLHAQLVRENPTVTFNISPNVTGGATVPITLPYGAFDLNVSYPITDIGDTQYYFPLRRATNSTQYTLGRVFLQEAYLIADYDRGNFTLAPCKWDTSITTQSIRAILSPGLAAAAAASAPASGMSTGAKAGIAVGVVGVFAITGAAIFFCLRKRKSHANEMQREKELEQSAAELAAAQAAARPKFAHMSSGELGTETGVHEMEHDHSTAYKFLPEMEGPHEKGVGEMEGEGYFAHVDQKIRVGVSEVEGSTPAVYELDAGEREKEKEKPKPDEGGEEKK